MEEAANTKVIQEAYAAFGRGDVAAILERIDDNVVWNGVYGTNASVPMSGERRGKAAVGEFFKQVAQHVKFSTFEPKEFVASGDKVVTLGHYTGSTPTGGSFDSDFAMVFTVRNGKVVGFQEFSDSAAINAAYAGAPA
jgi:ketosteroid isomerase-like protein